MREKSRWTELHDGRGGWDWVHDRGDMTENTTDGRSDRIGGNEKIQKIGGDRWSGRVRITCVLIKRA